jgi:hypothetical protein
VSNANLSPFARLIRDGTRGLIVLLGLVSASWGLITVTTSRDQPLLKRLTSQIIDGQPFSHAVLNSQISTLERVELAEYCEPVALRANAIIRLRIFEEVMSGTQGAVPEEPLAHLKPALKHSLSCLPSDSFMWFVLVWLESKSHRLQDRELEYLRLSNRLGPNEGWIELRRVRFALSIYDQLPRDLAEHTLQEFIKLVEQGLLDQMADNFLSINAELQELILVRLATVDGRHQDNFSRALARRGKPLKVPLESPSDARPWDQD